MHGPSRRNWTRPLLIVLALLLGLVFVKYTGVGNHLSGDWYIRLQAQIRQLGWWGPFFYLFLFIPVGISGCPVTPLIILGGVFGVIEGTLLASIGATAGACAAFLAARHGFRSWIERRFGHRPLFIRITEGARDQGWHMLMITRWVPLFPYNMQNFAYGLTRMSFTTFALVSWICLLPVTGAYVFAGGALISGRGEARQMVLYLAMALALFALLSLAPRFISRRFRMPTIPAKDSPG